MIVTMLWHGGINYAAPTQDDGEVFSSLTIAKAVFEERADFDPFYPCVESPEAWIFIGDTVGEYPDMVLRLGPRGGVIVERT